MHKCERDSVFFDLGHTDGRLNDPIPLHHGSAIQYVQGSPLGTGGFGSVHQGLEWVSGSLVALKHAPPASGHEPSLEREAHFLSRQSDEHIPAYFGFLHHLDSMNEHDYLALELVSGMTLKQRLESCGPLPCTESITILDQIAGVLERVYTTQTVLHRDLTPDNVLIGTNGQVKIIDWAMATGVYEKPDGFFVGDYRYATPESFTPQGITSPRSDVYILATFFHEMMTGEWPYGRFPLLEKGQQTTEEAKAAKAVICYLIMNYPPNALNTYEEVRGEYPLSMIDNLQNVQSKALAKNENVRYNSPVTYVKALREACT